MKKLLVSFIALHLINANVLLSHCQMPCGIYHDDMVYDQIDQYVETMYKGITVMTDSPLKSVKEKNEFVRWVIQKEKASDEAAQLLLTYFLQQKIKPGEEDTMKRIESVHKMLFMLVQIKQNVNRNLVEEFADEWEKFKLMFHIEGYECKIEMIKARKRAQKEAGLKEKQGNSQPNGKEHNHNQEHDHDHDHPHTH